MKVNVEVKVGGKVVSGTLDLTKTGEVVDTIATKIETYLKDTFKVETYTKDA